VDSRLRGNDTAKNFVNGVLNLFGSSGFQGVQLFVGVGFVVAPTFAITPRIPKEPIFLYLIQLVCL
jgi:hypothetical protein